MIRKILKTNDRTEYVKFAECYYCKCKYALIGHRSELVDQFMDYCPVCGSCLWLGSLRKKDSLYVKHKLRKTDNIK